MAWRDKPRRKEQNHHSNVHEAWVNVWSTPREEQNDLHRERFLRVYVRRYDVQRADALTNPQQRGYSATVHDGMY